jgi:hypothetical protein
MPGMVAHACNSSTQELEQKDHEFEMWATYQVQGQLELHSKTLSQTAKAGGVV